MAARPWTVDPHGPLESVDDNFWCVEGVYPPRPMIPRRMHVVRRRDGTLVFHNAVPVDDTTLAQLRALGRPAVLLVPSLMHTLDVAPFAERLGLQVYCPSPIRAEVAAKVPVHGDYAALPVDSALTPVPLEGVSTGEGLWLVHSTDGARAHVVTCDAVLNLPHSGGGAGWFMRFIGRATGGPRVGPFFKWRAVTDRRAFVASLRRVALTPGLSMLVPSHGAIVRSGAAAALEEAAAKLVPSG
jgi:hypothetical protein